MQLDVRCNVAFAAPKRIDIGCLDVVVDDNGRAETAAIAIMTKLTIRHYATVLFRQEEFRSALTYDIPLPCRNTAAIRPKAAKGRKAKQLTQAVTEELAEQAMAGVTTV